MPPKFEVDIRSQRKVRVRKPKNPIWPPGGHFESDSLQNKIWNLPDRSTFLPKFIYDKEGKLAGPTQILPVRVGGPALILKTEVTSLKINRLLPMATINMHMKFEIEIPKQTWLMLRKPCRLQTDGRTDGQTDGRTKWIQYTPPPTSLGGGIKSRSFYTSFLGERPQHPSIQP